MKGDSLRFVKKVGILLVVGWMRTNESFRI